MIEQSKPGGSSSEEDLEASSTPRKAPTLFRTLGQREREVIPVVTNRDLRRTWKTLAGQAGLSKEIRDRLGAIARFYGNLIGVKYGEPFVIKETMRVDDITAMGVRSL